MKEVDFSNILKEALIKEAFQRSCFEKIVSAGYYDLNPYIKESMISKPQFYAFLEKESSGMLPLFAKRYHDNIEDFSASLSKIFEKPSDMSDTDARAIVFYMYRSVATNDERISCTKNVLEQWNGHINASFRLKDQRSVKLNIAHNILYDENMVSLYFIDSIAKYSELMNEVAPVRSGRRLFFRGHENIDYVMQAGLFRNKSHINNENRMYQEMRMYCSDEFAGMKRFDVLAKMQMEGLATRLYALTANPLAALYFACGGASNTIGEFIIYQAQNDKIMYPESGEVSVLSALSLFSAKEQRNIYELSYLKAQKEFFNEDPHIQRIIREVRSEIPGFEGNIDPESLRKGVFVIPSRRDRRIDKQDIAYILCGLLDEVYGQDIPGTYLAEHRLTFKGKKVLCLVDNKKRLRRQLDSLGMNHSVLFPDIHHMAAFINEKYGMKE